MRFECTSMKIRIEHARKASIQQCGQNFEAQCFQCSKAVNSDASLLYEPAWGNTLDFKVINGRI